MQKLLRKMLLLALMFVPLVTMAQGFSFTCDFENEADATAWEYANGSNTNKWCIDTAVHNGTGNSSLYVSNDNGVSHAYSVSSTSNVYAYSTLTLTRGTYDVSYDWMCGGESSFDYLRVALVPASTVLEGGVQYTGISKTNLPEGWLALDDGVGLNASSIWSTITGTCYVPADGDYKLVFYWHNDFSGGDGIPAAIDNISITMPLCPAPIALRASGIINDQATLSWVETGSAASWIVEYEPANAAPGSMLTMSETASDTTITLTGLEYNTEYNVRIIADCMTEQSDTLTGTFRSACGEITLPYSYSFNGDVSEDMFPPCWYNINYSNAVVKLKNGQSTLRFASGAAVATPYIPLAGNMISLSFSLQREGSYSGSIQVGFATDLSDISNMTVVKTFSPTDNDKQEYDVEFTLMGEEAVDEGYIIFKQVNQTSTNWYYWLSDVNIRQVSDCRRPETMSANNVSYNSATLSWSAVTDASAYDVVYGKINDPDTSANTILTNIAENFVDIVDLESSTTYYMWVRNNCGGEYSDWRAGGEFITQKACAELLDVEITSTTTNGAALAWAFNTAVGAPATEVEVSYRVNGSTDPYTTATTYNNYYMFSGLAAGTVYEYSLRTICDQDTANAVTGVFVTSPCGVAVGDGNETTSHFPTDVYENYSYTEMLYPSTDLIGIDTIKGIAFNYSEDAGYIRNVDVYMGLTQRSSISMWNHVNADSLTKVAENATFMVNKGWSVINFDSVLVYDGTSNMVIVVYDHTGSWKSSRSVYYHAGGTSLYATTYSSFNPSTIGSDVDEFMGTPDILFCTTCPEPECAAPLVSVGEVNATDANLVWAPGGLDDSWVVEYKLSSSNDWIEFESTTSTSSTIMDLVPGSYYDARVGSICGDDTLYASVSFFTECAAIPVPYSDNFSNDELNPCLVTGNANGTSGYPSHSSSYGGMVYFGYSVGGYIVFPEFIDDIATLRLTYDVKASLGKQVVIYVGTDKNNWSTFTPIDTITTITDEVLETHMTYFNNYEGTGHFIAIQCLSSSMYIDNVVIENAPTCAVPLNLAISQITSDAAELSWSGDNGASENWIVEWTNVGTNEVFEEVVSETNYSFADLAADTKYEVMVYNLCGGDTIAALQPVSFRTNCGTMVLPFIESFETKAVNVFPTCWTSNAGENKIVGYSNTTTAGINSLQLDKDAVVISPLVPIAGNTIAVDFLLKRDDEDAGKIVVGFSTSNSSLAATEWVDTINPTDNRINQYEIDFSSITSTDNGYIVWKQIDRYSGWSSYNTKYYLDNIYIREISDCGRPESLTVSGIRHNQAFLNWSVVEGATEYEVLYGTVNDVNSSANISQITSNDTLTIYGLEGATTYYAWVRNICGDSYSDWRAANEFTTQVNCARLANVEVTQTTTTGIALSWTYNEAIGAPATSVELSWKSAADADYTSFVTDNNYYIINGLQSGTSYQLKLRTICSADTAADYVMTVSTKPCGTAVIGTSAYTNSNVPSNCNWNYSYSQMLYPASDLVGVDSNITSIAFDWAGNVETTRTWDIYMANTAITTLYPSNAIPFADLTLVGSGVSVDLSEGWCTITLTTPFEYHSDSNLVIAIDDNTGDYPYGTKEFNVHDGYSIFTHSDSQNPAPASASLSSTTSTVPNLLFPKACDDNACVAPLLVVGESTSTSIDLVWGSGNAGETWQVEYKTLDATDWTIANASVADTHCVVTGLNPGTFYDFRVGTNCSDEILYTTVRGLTNCAAVSAPLTENFNNEILNPCWIYGNTDEDGDTPYLNSNTLYMSYDPNSYAITPEFVDDLSSLHVLFSIKSYSTEDRQVIIAAGSDPSNISTFVNIDTFNVTESNIALPQECSLASYTGNGHYIAFFCPTGKVYIDDVTIETLPSCSYPTDVAASNITSDGATITWAGDNRLSNGWIINYNILGDNANIQTENVPATDYSYTLTGLLPNTSYEVLILNACTADTVAAMMPITFRTECGLVQLPYFETFENELVNTYHACWFTTNSHTYGDYYAEETAPSIDEKPGTYHHVLKFGDNVNMISPRIPVEGNRILVNFDAKVESTSHSGKLVLGFSTSNTSDSNMLVVDTIDFSNTSWNNYEYTFSSLTTTDTGYVVFKNVDNDPYLDYYGDPTYYNGFIDNVTIAINNGCSRVTNIAVSNVTTNTAVVSFNDSTSNNNYTIGYSTINDVNNVSDTISVTDTTYTFTSLQPNTKYYVWVRNNCVAGSSPWTAGPSFKTPCLAMTELPYVEDFNSYSEDVANYTSTPTAYPMHVMPNCWNFINMSSSNSTYPQAFISASTSYANNGNCLFMKSSESNPMYAILPQFTTHVNDLQISFNYRNEGTGASNGTLELGVMTDISNPASFVVVKTMPKSETITNISHNFAIDQLELTNSYVIAFRYVGARDNYYLSIDDVTVSQAPACATPEDVELTGISNNSATLSWAGAASSYNVQYRLATAADWTDAPVATSTTTTINGLNTQTQYVARVQSVCGTTVSEWSNTISFKTLCGAVTIPYTENFDSYTADIAPNSSAPSNYPNHAMPDCWSFPGLTDSHPKIFLSRHSAYATTGNCLFFTSSSTDYAYAVLPAMNVDVDSLQVSFTYTNEGSGSSNSPVTVGVMTNPSDTSTFRALETFPVSSEGATVEHSFSVDTGFVDGTTYFIAFRYGHNALNFYFAIDDVSVDYAPTCPRLAAPSVDNVTSTTADISWSGNATNYEVSYKAQLETAWTSQLASTTSVTLTNLAVATEYQVRVRSLCSATDTSEWSDAVTFTTECAVYDLPFSENFTASANVIGNLNCWERYKGLLSAVHTDATELIPYNGGWNSYESDLYPVNGGGSNVYVDIYGSSVKNWLVSPSLNITAGAALTFDMASRDWNNSTEYGSDDKFVVLATNDNGATWTELRTWSDTTYQNIPNFATGFDSINISLSQYAGQTIKIAFYGESTVSGGDHYVHIDNIEVKTDIPTCAEPTNLATNDITATTATISWNGSASTYDVEYRAQGDATWTSTTMSETTLALTNLQPLTTYEWQVRGNCGDAIGTSDWVTSTFTTLELPCPTPTNVTATVDGIDVTVDWTADEDQSSWEVIVFNLDTISQIVNAHPTTITGLSGASTYKVEVRAICAEGIYSEWTAPVEFTTATCEKVTNVAASDITANSAKITWTAGGNEAKWEINYGEAGFGQGQGEFVEATETSYLITNLEEETEYDVYVRALCGDNFYSLWSDLISFQTLAAETPEGIDGVDGQFNFNIYPNPTSGATTISLNGVEGQVTISVVDMNGRTVTSESIECGSDCEKRIDVAGLAQGTYFVRVLGDNINSVRKLIVR